jgi:hypothetical protein
MQSQVTYWDGKNFTTEAQRISFEWPELLTLAVNPEMPFFAPP